MRLFGSNRSTFYQKRSSCRRRSMQRRNQRKYSTYCQPPPLSTSQVTDKRRPPPPPPTLSSHVHIIQRGDTNPRGWPLIQRSWIGQLILDSDSDYLRFFGSVIGHLWAELETAVNWLKSVEFQADTWFLVAAWILTISEHVGPVQAAGTVRERVRP
jgi:hypothetical protein